MIMNVIMKGHKNTLVNYQKQNNQKQNKYPLWMPLSLICKRLLKTVCMAFWGKKLRLLVA